jgi:signal transduction histidine kinase/ActR/RegA family two-component response regulator
MTKKDPVKSGFDEFDESVQSLEWTDTATTEIIDLEIFSEKALTASGNFDLTGINIDVLARLLQSLPIPAFLLNPQFDVVFANQACSHIDWKYQNIQGKRFCSLFINASLGNEIQELLQGEFSQKYQVYADLQICDARIWGRMSFRRIRIKEFRAVLVIVENLTAEQKRLLLAKRHDEELNRMEKLESIGVLAGGIAHDFNNILTSILGNINLARMSSQSPDKFHRRLEEAEKAIDRAKNLTQQLLTFSRGGGPVKQTASISEMVRDTCEFVGRGSNVRCEFSITDNISCVDVDMGQISQVISNLIINAEQAIPDGGVINVQLENVSINIDELPLKEGKYLKLSIQDHGIGIPAKILPKIFDPYFTTKQKGSGLGLASAYSIVKSHDGLITVESELGTGTVFHVYLPVSDKAMAENKDLDHRVITGEGKLLLMDDDDMIRDMGKDMLILFGYEVDVAENGDEAIELYRRSKDSGNPYSAVILDLTVRGGMGGIETLLKLVEIEPTIKAVVSSGYSNDPIMADYKKYGFRGVVAKPYSATELSTTLYSIIAGSC